MAFDPKDLRDQATPERVERIGARLAKSVARASTRGGGPRRHVRAAWLAGAFAVVLASGVGAGRLAAPAVRSLGDRPAPVACAGRVFASGTDGKAYELADGSKLALDPGSTIELAHDGTTLRLLHGGASIEASRALAVIAGRALVSAPGGASFVVRRTDRGLDTSSRAGVLEVRAPDGRYVVRPGEPSRSIATADVPVASEAARSPSDDPTGDASRGPHARVQVVASSAPAAGSAAMPSSELPGAEAIAIMKRTGDAGAALDRARSADELTGLREWALGAGEGQLATDAARRLVDRHPEDPAAGFIAMDLRRQFEALGDLERARTYDAIASTNPRSAEHNLCDKLERSNANDAQLLAMAREYEANFPGGRCHEVAARLVAEAR